MEPCRLQHTTYEGLAALELFNGLISLTIVPELGGKITSIKQRTLDKEWLWRNPHLDYRRPTYGASYIEQFDLGGLDECFPSVSPVYFPRDPWAGVAIPDHGELWAQPWETTIVETSTEQIVLSMACYGVRLPYHFERIVTIEADRAVVRLDYKVINLSPYPLPFVWSIHPILNIEAGMRLVLPRQINRIRVDSSVDGFLGKMGAMHPWPLTTGVDGQTIDLSEILPAEAGRAAKFYTLPLQGTDPVEAIVTDVKNKHSFGFRFLPAEISHLGIWMNYGGWSGVGPAPYYNLGLEPCIGGADALTIAQRLNEYAILEAKQTRRWTLEMMVS